MSKLDDAIKNLEDDRLAGINGQSYAVVTGVKDLGVVLDWVKRVREKNPFLVGDKVALATTGDPDDAPEPTEGVVIGFAGPNAVLVSSGDYHSLYYPFDSVERIED